MGKVIALCFLAALCEGLDIQSMGVAAPHVGRALGLGPGAVGVLLSASIFGLMIGAALGGWASDRYGRRLILVFSMLTFGCFSLLTIAAGGLVSMTVIRFLTGLGLGGALPNLIALATDVTPPRRRVAMLGIVYSGLPLGGAMAGAIATLAGPDAWESVFIAGGVGPLLLAPLLHRMLPSVRPVDSAAPLPLRRDVGVSDLFGERTRSTALLWFAYFFTLLAVYLLLNWLPSLMVRKGVDPASAPQAAIYLNLGAVAGSLILGRLSDSRTMRDILIVTYGGMIASLCLLAAADGTLAMTASFATGFFVIGGQLVLYALAPMTYPFEARGTGIGAAVAVGRAGSVLGPLLGGIALSLEWGPSSIPLIAAPGLIGALLAALLLHQRISAGPSFATETKMR